jgi:prevent-host-death family protein
MKTIQLRDAKATLSALVDAAERGEPTVITRHGRPAAMLVSVDLAKRLQAPERRSLADFLLSIPASFEAERDQTPLRPAGL